VRVRRCLDGLHRRPAGRVPGRGRVGGLGPAGPNFHTVTDAEPYGFDLAAPLDLFDRAHTRRPTPEMDIPSPNRDGYCPDQLALVRE
jgi:hypothetical protein